MESHPSENPSIDVDGLKPYSCVVCRQRKIKCDRHEPCSNCIKAEVECRFVAPVRGKRKRTKPAQEGLHAKIRRYEHMLKEYGAKLDAPSDSEGSESPETPQDAPRQNARQIPRPIEHISFSRGISDAYRDMAHRYSSAAESTVAAAAAATATTTADHSNNNNNNNNDSIGNRPSSKQFNSMFWSKLDRQFQHPDEYMSEEATDYPPPEVDVLFESLEAPGQEGHGVSGLSQHFPSLNTMRRLKDIYADQIDPLEKILHLPTFWEGIRSTLEAGDNAPKAMTANVFCFCLATLRTMSDADIQSIFDQTKSKASAKYRDLSRRALVQASFLYKPDLMTLQAFALFMMGMKSLQRCDTMFIWSGIAVRLALRMNLHRDGSSLQIPPFETEMRRRLWWQIVHVDFRTADLLGVSPSLDLFIGDVKLPSNVEDEDLTPDMTEPPTERQGITSTGLCLVRCEILFFLRKLTAINGLDTSWDVVSNPSIAVEQRDRMVGELEDLLESKYLRYCDISQPLHTLVSIVVRSAVCKMRLVAHNPRRFAEQQAQLPSKEREIIFVNASKLLEYGAMVRQNKGLHKYLWRTTTSFVWDTILYALIATRHRKAGPDVERLWQLIGVVLFEYPDNLSDTAEAVNAALSKWIPEVWEEYATTARADGFMDPVMPEYIAKMRQRRAARDKPSPNTNEPTQHQPTIATGSSQDITIDNPNKDPISMDTFEFSDLMSFEMDPNGWMQWEELLSRHDDPGNFNL